MRDRGSKTQLLAHCKQDGQAEPCSAPPPFSKLSSYDDVNTMSRAELFAVIQWAEGRAKDLSNENDKGKAKEDVGNDGRAKDLSNENNKVEAKEDVGNKGRANEAGLSPVPDVCWDEGQVIWRVDGEEHVVDADLEMMLHSRQESKIVFKTTLVTTPLFGEVDLDYDPLLDSENLNILQQDISSFGKGAGRRADCFVENMGLGTFATKGRKGACSPFWNALQILQMIEDRIGSEEQWDMNYRATMRYNLRLAQEVAG